MLVAINPEKSILPIAGGLNPSHWLEIQSEFLAHKIVDRFPPEWSLQLDLVRSDLPTCSLSGREPHEPFP
jgi:hypothetical protein